MKIWIKLFAILCFSAKINYRVRKVALFESELLHFNR